jgi:hypothetical protein
MSDGANPYASPLSVSSTTTTASDDFRDVFLGWERLRVVYNSVLVSLTLLCGFGSVADPKFWSTALFGAILTNVCFCVGPVLEGYATWLSGRRVQWVRWGLFLVGQLIAAGLACTVILNAFPNNLTVFGF